MNLDRVQSELGKAANEFWLKFINWPTRFGKLIVGHGVKENNIKKSRDGVQAYF